VNTKHLRIRLAVLTAAMLAGLGAQSLAALPCDRPVLVVERQQAVGDIPAYAVGASTIYSIRCAPANAHILWSSTLNTLPTGEDHFDYGQMTDGSGCVRRRTDDVINTALSLGVPYIFNWLLFDNADFGIYDFAGQGHSLASYFETRLPGNSYQPESCP
jgi:hypothetical protein